MLIQITSLSKLLAACSGLGQFFPGRFCFSTQLALAFLILAFQPLAFAQVFGLVIVSQPAKILLDRAFNLLGFAFDFILVQYNLPFLAEALSRPGSLLVLAASGTNLPFNC
jgi:hypothetical protein